MGKRLRKTINRRPSRERKKIIVVGTEGNNKTEKLYLTELEKTQLEYHFIFPSCNNTDPKNIIESAFKESKKQGVRRASGDMTAALFDIDLDNRKKEIWNEIENLSSTKKVDLYTSNPCFELWILNHFKCTTKPYASNEDVIKELKKFYPEYEKNKYDFSRLDSSIYKAIVNARQAQRWIKEVSKSSEKKEFYNPNTDVYLLVEKVLPEIKKGGKKE